MSYVVEPINVTGPLKEKVVDPRSKKTPNQATSFQWWLAGNDKDLCTQLLSTAQYLKTVNYNVARVRQASVFSRLVYGKPLYNYLASSSALDSSSQLPIGRPTANVCYSCTDTIVSRIGQDKPSPTFLTDGGDYKQRKLATQANSFILGEFFRTKAYETTPLMMRDACVLGNGLVKVFPKNKKVCVERTLETELLTDYNDAYYGDPRQLIQLKLVDRSVYLEMFPEEEEVISTATSGNVDNSPRSTETVSDQFIIAEGWHLPSSEFSNDGLHAIACSRGLIHKNEYKRDRFPFVKLGYNPNIVGWFSQGLVEILMPTQMELYRQLIVASQSLELMGVPRVLIEETSKILETAFNNRIGSIIKYRNTPPQFVNAQANNPEIYNFIQWLIQNAYQISGISALSASGNKPAGLNSGESIRQYDAIQEDRFKNLATRYQTIFPELAYQMIDCAQDIVEETGEKYTTVFPDKDGTHVIDFKTIGLLKDTYVIQCYDESFLPKEPAGRQAKLSEMLAANEITLSEFRRLSNFPDLKQSDQLAAALEERILQNLDAIVEDGKKGYTRPDNFMLDPSDLATTLTVQYINKYSITNLEPEKMDLLRTYFTQVQDVKAEVAQGQAQAQAAAQAAQQQQQQAQLPVQPPQQSVAPTSNAQV